MSVKITLEFATTEAAIVALAAVRSVEGKSDAPKPETAKDTAAPTKPAAKPKPAAAETAPTADTAPIAASPTPPTTSSGPSRDEMAAAIKAAVGTHRAQVVETLAKYGAKVGKDLKDEQIAPFLADLAEATKPADDLAG